MSQGSLTKKSLIILSLLGLLSQSHAMAGQMAAETSGTSIETESSLVRYLSAGLQALDQGNFETAITSFQAAVKAYPQSPQAREALLMAETALSHSIITQLKEQAQIAEAKEAWREAIRSYDSVLERDPHIHFALVGKKRAHERAELIDSLSSYLEQPQRLAARAVLNEARLVLGIAKDLKDPGAKLARLTERLEGAINTYSLPVPVVLSSDGETEVTIYKVGTMGKFTNKNMDLRPGTYVVVGSREGYRDHRFQFTVKAGQKLKSPIDIRCKEKI